jgi:hypothetical protein
LAVLAFAPRFSPRLIDAIVRLDDRMIPIAEVNRRVGEEAERLGLRRLSYQRVRVLVHQLRRVRKQPTTAAVLFEVAVRARPPEAFLEHVSGVGVKPLA